MLSRPLQSLLLTVFCTSMYQPIYAQTPQPMIVYDVATKTYTTRDFTEDLSAKHHDQTNPFYGTYNNITASLPTITATTNLNNHTSFTNKENTTNHYETDAYPLRAMVTLVVEDNGELFHNCSATMVSSRHVLTAAHCLVDLSNPNEIKFDSVYAYPAYNNGEQIDGIPAAQVTKIYFFEGWNSGMLNDIMILELAEPIGEISGWLGVGYDDDNSYFENHVFHKLSYPGVKLLPEDLDFNGDTLYHSYGNLNFFGTNNDDFLGVIDYNAARPGDSGSSVFYTDNQENYTAFGVASMANNMRQCRINHWKFTAIESIIREYTIAPNPNLAIAVEVYPNPTTDFVKLKFNQVSKDLTIFVLDASGRQVVFKNVGEDELETEINLSDFSNGMYYFNISNGEKMITKQVMKM